MHIDPTAGRGNDPRLATTAYIAWAVFRGDAARSNARPTLNYLLAHRPDTIHDPYLLALMSNALIATGADPPVVRSYLDRLLTMKQTAANGKQTWWEQPSTARTVFHGAGEAGSIETTALATLALLESRADLRAARGALTWLVGQKDRLGTWHTTQATVLALQALLAGTGGARPADKPRVIEWALNGRPAQRIELPADQSEVMTQVDLSGELNAGPNILTISESTQTGVGYQVDFWYHVPPGTQVKTKDTLSIDIAYDRTDLTVGDTVVAEAAVTNNATRTAPMVILDLPIPAGFAADTESLRKMQAEGRIAKYQVTARTIVIYLRQLAPRVPLRLRYRLQATMPVKITVPPARVYEYYDPDNNAETPPTQLTVTTA
jgi:uncharacterized protein YfaS (alpha-2-macroglobulin family)